MINDYMSLSTRAGFNKSLGHFRLVNALVEQMEKGGNLADLVDELEKQKQVEKSQIGPILNAVVMDRYSFSSYSFNLPFDIGSFDMICEETQKWNRLDCIVAYHHPQLGISLINPKRKAHWDALQDMQREELVVFYVKGAREQDRSLEQNALAALEALLLERPAGDTAQFHDPALERKAPKPAAKPQPKAAAPRPAPSTRAPAPPAGGKAAAAAAPAEAAPAGEARKRPAPSDGGKRRVTPKYSVQVTNELFHNGNVEAWKNIIESYKSNFPNLDVHVFHDGEKVNNINALFKWGKVKNGDVLLFSVSGEDIKGVAKLQRYLFEGASPRFHNFLKKDVNKVLSLF